MRVIRQLEDRRGIDLHFPTRTDLFLHDAGPDAKLNIADFVRVTVSGRKPFVP
jgi:hypothetical protein